MTTHLAATAIDVIQAMHPAGMILKRATVGAYVNGRWVEGVPAAPQPIDGTCHAMSAKAMNDLPTGLRHDDMRVVHTRELLRIHTDDATGDVVEYNGRDYKVLQVNERPEGAYYRAVIGHNHVRTNTI